MPAGSFKNQEKDKSGKGIFAMSKGTHAFSIGILAGGKSTRMGQNKAAFDFDLSKTKGDSISGTITAENDGYLTTSFVYHEGMTAEIDGEKVTPEKVNTAFVGLPVKKGTHKVTITYHAPWLNYGMVASGAGFAVFVLIIILDIKNRKKNK